MSFQPFVILRHISFQTGTPSPSPLLKDAIPYLIMFSRSLELNSSHGLPGDLEGRDLGFNMAVAGFCAIALTNGLEVFFRAWFNFRRHDGFYFWAINATVLGNILYIAALLLKSYNIIRDNLAGTGFVTISWVFMVTGQSLILYSRLRLIVSDPGQVRWVLWMILSTGFCLHTPTVVLAFGVRSKYTLL
jgi:hypothetical protein